MVRNGFTVLMSCDDADDGLLLEEVLNGCLFAGVAGVMESLAWCKQDNSGSSG
jgi:hypothetical protein